MQTRAALAALGYEGYMKLLGLYLDGVTPIARLGGLASPKATRGGVCRDVSERWAEAHSVPSEAIGDAYEAHLARLGVARGLPLTMRPLSPAAAALVAEVVATVAPFDAATRERQRRPAGRLALQKAVGAVVGGLLTAWGHVPPRLSCRSSFKTAFEAGVVSSRQFFAAVNSMAAAELIDTQKGVRWGNNFGSGMVAFDGRPACYWPTAALLAVAERHGLTPDTIGEDFRREVPTRPPRVTEAVTVNSLKDRAGGSKKLSVVALGSALAGLRADVEALNDYAGKHAVAGCLPPRFRRGFTEVAELGGRFYAVGCEAVFQGMSKASRAAITINGEPIVEVDVEASHLAILHGLMGLPLPAGDPYDIPGLPRSVVKRFMLEAIGKGAVGRRWSRMASTVSYPPFAEVSAAVAVRFPWLPSVADRVAVAAGLTSLEHIGSPKRLLIHRLMRLEAEAIGLAIVRLRADGVLALPVHDSLIVPRDAVNMAVAAIELAFAAVAGITPRAKVGPAPPYHLDS